MNIPAMFFIAVFIEGTVNYLAGTSDFKTGPREWLKYVALAMGVILSIGYKLDLLAQAGLDSQIPLLGYVVTGVIIGRGSNYLNDAATLIGKKLTKK